MERRGASRDGVRVEKERVEKKVLVEKECE